MAGRLWIDVEDLFEYARGNPRPSGIQRLAFEIYRNLQKRSGESGAVRFVRHDPIGNSLRIVSWAGIEGLFAGLSAAAPPPPLPGAIRPHSAARQLVRELTHRLPSVLRIPITEVLLSSRQACVAWLRLGVALCREAMKAPRAIARRLERARSGRTDGAGGESGSGSGEVFAELVSPGDVFLVLGSPWSHPDYAGLVRKLRDKHGMRFGLLVYDLIPLRRPEWCDRGLVRLFRAWFDSVFPLCDHVFAISRATAADVEKYADELAFTLPRPVVTVPIGTGFSTEPAKESAPSTNRLPAAGTYALIVSTIEARKNHLLLFRVWRRMLEELPPERIPTLVFAGRVGWLVEDLMHQIANTDNLNGKLVLIQGPSDAELATLYKGCLFTLFPSFFEGWGLPVTESFAFGKPCLISNRTSLPEAGGKLARSFDPDDLNEAYAVIRNAIEDRSSLETWEAQVRREFEPVSWSATADTLLAGLDLELAPASAERAVS